MAEELKLRLSATFELGNIKESFNPGQIAVNIGTIGRAGYVQSITTGSTTIISFGDLTTPGYAFFRNVSTANFVDVGPQDSTGVFVSCFKLEPGEAAVLRLSTGITLLGRANTTNVLLQSMILPSS